MPFHDAAPTRVGRAAAPAATGARVHCMGGGRAWIPHRCIVCRPHLTPPRAPAATGATTAGAAAAAAAAVNAGNTVSAGGSDSAGGAGAGVPADPRQRQLEGCRRLAVKIVKRAAHVVREELDLIDSQ